MNARGDARLVLLLPAQPLKADDPPEAISCCRDGANAGDIDAHVACLAADAGMIDVSRTITGRDAIRAWALQGTAGCDDRTIRSSDRPFGAEADAGFADAMRS